MAEPRPQPQPTRAADWEAFYASYRKPGYVPGFEITSKLGGGMFGLVFKATRQSIGKDYAIKFLKVDDEQVRAAVLQEVDQVRHFAQIDHPNLVAIEDLGEVDGIPYLVMAYAGSQTLRDLLPGDASTREELLRLFLQACRGVAALHERSLVHFDLKPANVFLKGGVARVGDYGLSKLVTHSQGSLSMGRGTPYYMAPEMLRRRGDHRSDIYSLGVMLFEVLTGDVPFKGDSEWAVLKAHETAPVVFPPSVSARDRAIVERCLAKDPAQRYQQVGDLLAAFGAPTSVGAAAFADAGNDSFAREEPPPPPPPGGPQGKQGAADDPYDGLRKASKEAYRHAGKIARDAVQHANTFARKAAAGVRVQTMSFMRGSRGRHARRAHAWVRWFQMYRSRRQRERAARRAARRQSLARAFRVLLVGGMVMALVVLAMMMVMPSSMQPSTSATVASASMPTEPQFAVAEVPKGFRGAIGNEQQRWVGIAASDPERARSQLDRQLQLFRSRAPLAIDMRLRAPKLPRFGPVLGVSVDQRERALALIAEVQKADSYQPEFTARAIELGPPALCFAAEQLQDALAMSQGQLDSQSHRAAENLQALLVDATGFEDLQIADDPDQPIAVRANANLEVGDLWLWLLFEIGDSQATWRAYQQLRGR